MTRHVSLIVVALCLLFCPHSIAQAENGFVPLFDGQTLDGWVNVNGAPDTWSAREGVIHCTGTPLCELRTERMYQNFILKVQWRHLRPKGNAGIFVWCDAIPVPGEPFNRGIEVQVLDGREEHNYTSDGDIFPINGATMVPDNPRGGDRAFPTEKRSKPSPEWNDYVITCIDGTITLAVNGKVVTSGSECSPRKGYIILESEGSPVEFRDLLIKVLPSSDLPADQVAKVDEGFVSLYNRVDLSGWKVHEGLVGHWKPGVWILYYDGQATGEDKNLWTEESFGDFTLIADWRWSEHGDYEKTAKRPVILPSGAHAVNPDGTESQVDVPIADSGIYLRGSSKAQINIWQWPVGSGEIWGFRTDQSQPAEIRAAATPSRKADNPVGEWNRFEITMRGEHVTVVLNGETVIERCHLPGVPAEGPIALQHHGNPIDFANLFVKRH